MYLQSDFIMQTNTPEKIYIICSNYSMHSHYALQKYIAHHLIRAALSREFIPYINQYYLIKEKCPNLNFWNKIVLCQFGFQMYYYYWLTGSRFMRSINDDDFKNVVYKFPSSSTRNAFYEFEINLSPAVINDLKKAYLNQEFEYVLTNLRENIKVRPTDDFKSKTRNFDFKNEYSVELELPTKYVIAGDNFVRRAYLKKNFVKVN